MLQKGSVRIMKKLPFDYDQFCIDDILEYLGVKPSKKSKAKKKKKSK